MVQKISIGTHKEYHAHWFADFHKFSNFYRYALAWKSCFSVWQYKRCIYSTGHPLLAIRVLGISVTTGE